jgi:hypothetical protein
MPAKNLRRLLANAIVELSDDELTIEDYNNMIGETEIELTERLISIAQWYKIAAIKEDTFD